MRLSIVTVCYNAEDTIDRCILSVLEIEGSDFEYLIVDGKSTDKTLEIAKKYTKEFEKKGIRYTIFSECDSGIYNAMNKGIDLCSGDYILYLNSDDSICKNTDFDAIFELGENADVIYGDVEIRRGRDISLQKARDLERLKSGVEMPFCHQSTLTKRLKLQKYRYDEEYKIIADIDLFLRMYEDQEEFKYVPICISTFSNDGVSQTNRIESMIEGKKLLKTHGYYKLDRCLELNARIIWYWAKRIRKSFGKRNA